MRSDKLKRGDKVRCVLTDDDFVHSIRSLADESPAIGIITSIGGTMGNKPVLSIKVTKAGIGCAASVGGIPFPFDVGDTRHVYVWGVKPVLKLSDEAQELFGSIVNEI